MSRGLGPGSNEVGLHGVPPVVGSGCPAGVRVSIGGPGVTPHTRPPFIGGVGVRGRTPLETLIIFPTLGRVSTTSASPKTGRPMVMDELSTDPSGWETRFNSKDSLSLQRGFLAFPLLGRVQGPGRVGDQSRQLKRSISRFCRRKKGFCSKPGRGVET